jgi:hypothetical protein
MKKDKKHYKKKSQYAVLANWPLETTLTSGVCKKIAGNVGWSRIYRLKAWCFWLKPKDQRLFKSIYFLAD